MRRVTGVTALSLRGLIRSRIIRMQNVGYREVNKLGAEEHTLVHYTYSDGG